MIDAMMNIGELQEDVTILLLDVSRFSEKALLSCKTDAISHVIQHDLHWSSSQCINDLNLFCLWHSTVYRYCCI